MRILARIGWAPGQPARRGEHPILQRHEECLTSGEEHRPRAQGPRGRAIRPELAQIVIAEILGRRGMHDPADGLIHGDGGSIDAADVHLFILPTIVAVADRGSGSEVECRMPTAAMTVNPRANGYPRLSR